MPVTYGQLQEQLKQLPREGVWGSFFAGRPVAGDGRGLGTAERQLLQLLHGKPSDDQVSSEDQLAALYILAFRQTGRSTPEEVELTPEGQDPLVLNLPPGRRWRAVAPGARIPMSDSLFSLQALLLQGIGESPYFTALKERVRQAGVLVTFMVWDLIPQISLPACVAPDVFCSTMRIEYLSQLSNVEFHFEIPYQPEAPGDAAGTLSRYVVDQRYDLSGTSARTSLLESGFREQLYQALTAQLDASRRLTALLEVPPALTLTSLGSS